MEISLTAIIAIIAIILVLKLIKKVIGKIIGIAVILVGATYVLSTFGIIWGNCYSGKEDNS